MFGRKEETRLTFTHTPLVPHSPEVEIPYGVFERKIVLFIHVSYGRGEGGDIGGGKERRGKKGRGGGKKKEEEEGIMRGMKKEYEEVERKGGRRATKRESNKR